MIPETPSKTLMESLWEAGASIRAFDSEAIQEVSRIYGNRTGLELVDTKEDALIGADALIICTEYPSFRAPAFNAMRTKLNQPIIF